MGKKTILLVEDDGAVRELLRGGLERNYNILEASGCSEAKKQLSNHIDLALVDYYLPDSNGLDVLKAIREVKHGVPFILMTAYSTESLAIKALRAEVTDYIKKPLSFVYLKGKLSEILDGKKDGGHPETVSSREVFIADSIAAFIEDNYT